MAKKKAAKRSVRRRSRATKPKRKNGGALPRDTPPIATVKAAKHLAKRNGCGESYLGESTGFLTRGDKLAEEAKAVSQAFTREGERASRRRVPKRIVLIEKTLKDDLLEDIAAALPPSHPARRNSIVLDPTVSFRAAACPRGW